MVANPNSQGDEAADSQAPGDVPVDREGGTVSGERGEHLNRFLVRAVDTGFNGSALVAIDGSIVLHKGFGWADRERARQVTTTTPFWIASISKQFAAAAILKLAEQGRLSVEDSIAGVFETVPADKRDITIHRLLTHTAGLEQHYAADGIADRDSAVRAILSRPLASAPGERFGYSNDAYNLIAAIVEIIAAQPYEVYLRGQLLEPAGLEHTGFWGPADHPKVAAILGEGPGSDRPNWGFRGAVGMFSTSGDLHRWYRALENDTVLAEGSRRSLLSSHVDRGALGVGYGWFTSQTPQGSSSVWTRGYESFGHGAILTAYPKERVVIAITSNSGERSRDVPVTHALAEELAAVVFAPQ